MQDGGQENSRGGRESAARRLEALLGDHGMDRVRRPDVAGDDRELPRAHPQDVEALREVIRACGEEGIALHIEGGGGCPAVHLPPAGVDAVLCVDKLDRVEEHEPGDLVVRVQGGCTLASLQAALAPSGQFLPVEVASPGEATIGGILASRAVGPSRLLYGTPRDRLLGIAFVDGTGRLIRAGGRVVKNVAGYDLMKLLVGSYGTLGVIVEATLRVQPSFAGRAVWVAVRHDPGDIPGLLTALRRGVATPAFLTVANPGRSATLDPRISGWTVAAGLDGTPEETEGQRRLLDAAASRAGWSEKDLRWLSGLEAIAWSRNTVSRLGGAIDADVWVEMHVPPGREMRVLKETGLLDGPAGRGKQETPGGARRGAEARRRRAPDDAGGPLHLQVDAGSGIAALAWRDGGGRSSSALLWRLLGPLQEAGGFLRILRASPELRREAAGWGPQPAALAVSRRLKDSFDPRRILAPGRIPGGI